MIFVSRVLNVVGASLIAQTNRNCHNYILAIKKPTVYSAYF